MDVLSNDQVAALVAAARAGTAEMSAPAASIAPATPATSAGPPIERRRRPRRVREIDFSRPTKFTTDQMRRIERAHEAFCRAAGGQLSTDLRAEIELEVINISQLTLAGALADVPASTLYGVVRLDDVGTPILFGIELNAVTTMIERLLGGGSLPPVAMPADREMTEIEKALARRVFSRVVEELSTVWDELFQTTLSLDRVETQLMNVQLAPPSEPTVSITIEFRLGEMAATASLVVPYRSIEDVVGRLPSAQAEVLEHEGDAQAAADVKATLSSIEVQLRVEVGAVEVPLERIVELKAGDVLPLGAPSSAGVIVYADGVATHRARPGRRGRRRAIEILERLEAGR